MPSIRLDKIVSDSGVCSRSGAAALIKSGRVAVDGKIVLTRAAGFDPDAVRVTVDGKPVDYSRYRYIILNKPKGYVSATEDRYEKTVMELLDEKYSKLGLFPAGRLDKDAEGLLLLTNDGDLAHKVMSPAAGLEKRYFVELDSDITAEDIKVLSEGITLGDGTKCQPAVLEHAQGGAFVTLHEGKYHQVKRMMAALGKPVKNLTRVSIGRLELDPGLKPGQYREIHRDIINEIYELETKK